MSINLNDVTPGGYELNIRLTVKTDSDTFNHLNSLLINGTPEKGLIENLGVSGTIKVMSREIFNDRNNNICATFDLMGIEVEDV